MRGCSHWNSFLHLEDIATQFRPLGRTTTDGVASEYASSSFGDDDCKFPNLPGPKSIETKIKNK